MGVCPAHSAQALSVLADLRPVVCVGSRLTWRRVGVDPGSASKTSAKCSIWEAPSHELLAQNLLYNLQRNELVGSNVSQKAGYP